MGSLMCSRVFVCAQALACAPAPRGGGVGMSSSARATTPVPSAPVATGVTVQVTRFGLGNCDCLAGSDDSE